MKIFELHILFINFIIPINFLHEIDSIKKKKIPATGIISYIKSAFCMLVLHSWQGQLLGFPFVMP